MVNPPRNNPVDRVVVEPHSKKRQHQKDYARVTGKKSKCDVRGCKLKNPKVARALSRVFVVDNSKGITKSRIVLAEVVVSDYPSVEAAKRAVREMAEKPVRPLILDILNRIKRPLEHGYTEDEVFKAMFPYIMRHAKMYSNHNSPTEDAINLGWWGIRKSLETDRAFAPFANHAFLHIRTNIRRPTYESGLIRKGERDHDASGMKGAQIGFEIDDDGNIVWKCSKCANEWSVTAKRKPKKCPQCKCSGRKGKNQGDNISKIKKFGSLTSADAELGDSFTLKDAMASEDVGPLEIVMEADAQDQKKEILRLIIQNADLSDQQLEVLVNKFGFGPSDNAAGMTGTETASKLKISRQRVGQQLKKCMEKLRASADDLGYDWDIIAGM